MHDGTEIAADILLPSVEGPVPAIVLRTPYVRGRNASTPRPWILRFVDCGYALVTVDCRGRNDSGGDWKPRVSDPQDAHDVIEWVARQSWCTGKVGMVGGSYEGVTQWWAALGRPPHLSCITPIAAASARQELHDFGTGISSQYRSWWLYLVSGRTQQYPGGPSWEAEVMHTPLKTLDQAYGIARSAWKKYVAGEIQIPGDAGTLRPEDYAKIDIPVLTGMGWWDDQSTMLGWQELQRAKSAQNCRLLIGAWDHGGNMGPRPVLGGLDVSASVMDTVGYIEQFLALHLKGERNTLSDSPRCRIFMTGENRWDECDDWPHPRAVETSWYLASEGDARSLRGNGRLMRRAASGQRSDSFIYDPNHSGRDMTNLATFAWSDPPLDVRYLQRCQDALVYTSEPLSEPLMVSGRCRMRVFVASDRPDTDLFIHLSDVHPDGRAIGFGGTMNCLRLRYRNGPDPEPIQPGEIYEVTIGGSWLHHVFRAGHRLRVMLNSSNFPWMARNAGTGRHWAEDEVLFRQTNTIYHSSQYPSQVLLPVVLREEY